ncbi:MAG TPA: hypothetical protein VIP05_15705 [Burkholderiaceae bacterium]
MNNTPPPLERLSQEARLLGDLLDQHVRDRQHLAARSGRLIHFIDAHELKSYLHANDGSYLDGFRFHAEGMLFGAEGDSILRNVRLKAEHVLHWLLFEQPAQVVLLPSHGEEIDEEIAYQARQELRRQLDLLDAARAELGRMRENHLSNQLLTKLARDARDGEQDSRKLLIQFLGASAPAVSALLRTGPDTMSTRINRLVEESRLVLFGDVEWTEFGFSLEQAERIRALEVEQDAEDRWHAALSSARENSLRSNRVDARAIAMISAFNALLADMDSPARGALVTRATALINVVRQARRAGAAAGLAGDLVRHARLLVGDPFDGNARAAGRPEDDRAGDMLAQLHIALKTYERQLATPHAADDAYVADEARRLVTAWNEFEAARFTMVLAHGDGGDVPEGTIKTEGIAQLLAWLQDDSGVEELVLQRLKDGVWSFHRDTSTQSAPERDQIPMRVIAGAADRRIAMCPVFGDSAMPVVFRAPIVKPSLVSLIKSPHGIVTPMSPTLSLEEQYIAEEYLYTALAHSSRSAWDLVEIYSDSAAMSAQVLRQNGTESEARLMLARALRLQGVATASDRKRRRNGRDLPARLKRCGRELKEAGVGPGDVRLAFEKSALQLERLLSLDLTGDEANALLTGGLREAEQACTAAQGDPWVLLQGIEIVLTYLYAGRWVRALPDQSCVQHLQRVRLWHGRLAEHLAELRDQAKGANETLPKSALAVELLGYDLIRKLAQECGEPEADAVEIPSGLLIIAEELRQGLARRSDGVGQMIHSALKELISSTGGEREYALVYAPVWEAGIIRVLEQGIPAGPSREAAIEASRIVHDAGDHQRGLGGDVDARRRLERACRLFDEALANTRGASEAAVFQLRMQHCYARLLQSAGEKNPRRKADLLERLDRDYAHLLSECPRSAALWYRRSIVLTEMQRDDEALNALRRALEGLNDGSEPFSDHWVTSTMQRRLAFSLGREGRNFVERAKAEPDNAELKTSGLNSLRAAFRMLHERFDEGREPRGIPARLEHQRRLNNIVYYGSLYLDGGGVPDELSDGVDLARLKALVARLHPDGLDKVTEPTILHTIGYAYSVLGDRDHAAAAGDLLLPALVRSGADLASKASQDAMADARHWQRHAVAQRAGTTSS